MFQFSDVSGKSITLELENCVLGEASGPQTMLCAVRLEEVFRKLENVGTAISQRGKMDIANNIVNNLALGLIAASTIQAAHTKGLMANAVLIGVDLGPNLSVTGSLATILWLLALRKDSCGGTSVEKLDVSFWKFLKVGAVAMPVALFAALGGAVLMQMLVGRHHTLEQILRRYVRRKTS
jgi:hypothetical protein